MWKNLTFFPYQVRLLLVKRIDQFVALTTERYHYSILAATGNVRSAVDHSSSCERVIEPEAGWVGFVGTCADNDP